MLEKFYLQQPLPCHFHGRLSNFSIVLSLLYTFMFISLGYNVLIYYYISCHKKLRLILANNRCYLKKVIISILISFSFSLSHFFSYWIFHGYINIYISMTKWWLFIIILYFHWHFRIRASSFASLLLAFDFFISFSWWWFDFRFDMYVTFSRASRIALLRLWHTLT